MPLYTDLSYYGGASYSPYYTPTTNFTPSFSGYNPRTYSSSTYSAPPARSTFAAINRHYKPMLTPISESSYQPVRRPQTTLTNLTRINSPKINIHHSSYAAPRPIQMNTADIDVSSTKFHNRTTSNILQKSPDRIVYGTATSPSRETTPTTTTTDSPFMPRIDQNDPPQFRATIKRDRNIVRLSTVRTRSKSRSNKSDSSGSDDKASKSPQSSSKQTLTQNYSTYQPPAEKQGKTSWRDRFGEELLTKQPKDVVKKTPGELILEKHIIKDKIKEHRVDPIEMIYLEPKLRKSIRRLSLAKCPSFKDICNDISADLKVNDDLNAGELRRRASLIFEEEQQILLTQITQQRRRSSTETIQDRLEEPIVEEISQKNQKSHRTSKKIKPKIIATINVDGPIEELIEGNKSPKWKAVVEDEEHTVHKVVSLPKKRLKPKDADITKLDTKPKKKQLSPLVQKSESGEDFWGAIGSRETVYYDRRRQELLAIEMKRKEESMAAEKLLEINTDQIKSDINETETNKKLKLKSPAEEKAKKSKIEKSADLSENVIKLKSEEAKAYLVKEEEKAKLIKEAAEEEKARKVKAEEEKAKLIKEAEEEKAKKFKAEQEKAKLIKEAEEEKARKIKAEQEKAKLMKKAEEEKARRAKAEQDKLIKEAEEEKSRKLKAKQMKEAEEEKSRKLKAEQEQAKLIKEAEEEKARKLKADQAKTKLIKEAEEEKAKKVKAEQDKLIKEAEEEKARNVKAEQEKAKLAKAKLDKDAEEEKTKKVNAEIEQAKLIKEAEDEKAKKLKNIQEKEKAKKLKEDQEKARKLKAEQEQEKLIKEAEQEKVKKLQEEADAKKLKAEAAMAKLIKEAEEEKARKVKSEAAMTKLVKEAEEEKAKQLQEAENAKKLKAESSMAKLIREAEEEKATKLKSEAAMAKLIREAEEEKLDKIKQEEEKTKKLKADAAEKLKKTNDQSNDKFPNLSPKNDKIFPKKSTDIREKTENKLKIQDDKISVTTKSKITQLATDNKWTESTDTNLKFPLKGKLANIKNENEKLMPTKICDISNDITKINDQTSTKNTINNKDVVKIPQEEPSKKLTMQTDLKIANGLEAKSPETKQKQTKVKDFNTMKEENKTFIAATNKIKLDAENINKPIKGSALNITSGRKDTINDHDDDDRDDNTRKDDTLNNTTKNKLAEIRSNTETHKIDNQITSSPNVVNPLSPIYRTYEEVDLINLRSSTKKLERENSRNMKKDAKSIRTNADQDDLNASSSSIAKFATVANLNNLSSLHSTRSDYCISGEESDIASIYYSSESSEFSDSDTDNPDNMGLKRRHKKKDKKKNFDPKKMVKLDQKRKCYVVEETPKYPLIATPRPLQKRWHYYSESETESDESTNSDSESGDDCSFEDQCQSPNSDTKDVRMSTCSNDSGFEGGTAPTSPKKMLDCDVNCHKKCEKLTANLCGVNQKLIVEALSSVRRGVREARDSPTTPPSHNPAFKIDSNHDNDDLETSYTFAQFQRSGRITAPATTIPRFKKYAVDDFHFLTVLGKGSFGKVLLAELRNTEYYYAVKCLKKDVVLEDDDVECTLIERKVLALGTKHPYLCHLFCTFQTESHLFFVMEYLNGGDLMFHIQVSGRFPEPRAKFYAAEIISGLKFLHKKGIIYRDLKLDNILLDFDGHVRIADFGMCKLQIYLDRTADSFCGTPDYMAPEVIKGLKYNQAVDWWSFGVLLYEMLIGQSPFSGCDEDELFWSICNEIPWYPFYLSKDALNVLSKLLEKDSNTRLGAPTSPHEDITENVFFYEIDWKKLERRQLEPPFKPQVKHPLDTQYFDRAFTRERVRLTPIDKEILQSMDQQQFQGFTYTNPNATPS